jgi:hypothetical protein
MIKGIERYLGQEASLNDFFTFITLNKARLTGIDRIETERDLRIVFIIADSKPVNPKSLEQCLDTQSNSTTTEYL